ncbi:MAG: PD40 domain-containing protein [Flavobacteriales bacterium]|nr:PD40 domain-containing protein [Flavobacteriales bacterium]MCB9194341.1 PD40 domain-containing protein [Flavobacteriales bacterium]
MKKHGPLLCLALMVTGSLQAQKNFKRVHDRMLDEAEFLLTTGDYLEASRIFERLVPVDTDFTQVGYELGRCYLELPGQKSKAVPLFERGVRQGHTESYYQLALARHRQERFDEEIDLLNAYKQLFHREVDDPEVDRHIAIARAAKAMEEAPVELRTFNMGPRINGPDHDYCPLVTADGNTLYFTSRREGTTGEMRDPNRQYFEDIYVAHRTDDIWSDAMNVGAPLNTALHDATVGLDPDGSAMIIYRTGRDLVSGDLFESKLVNGQWTEPAYMTEQINSPYQEASASISPDHNEIYFSSDRPGGFGGKDLYRIRRLPNGQWSLPLNLGPTVNTPFDEDAPFMHSDGTTLFFCSNGHNTMGGYDIFKTVLMDPDHNGWADPENMGYPLNTVNDDIYFTLSADGTTGYFSSERPGGLGAQDIYRVEFPKSQLDYTVVHGLVVNAMEGPVKARVLLTDENGEAVVGLYNTNARNGKYLMIVQPDRRYHMRVEANGYVTSEELLSTTSMDGTQEMDKVTRLLTTEETERLSRNEH